MVIILMGLIVFAAIFFVGYPLVNAQHYEYAETGLNGDEAFEHLASARNSVFEAIRDLEFDRATGKLSDADYQAMRARYDAKAAQVLQKIDALGAAKTKRAPAPTDAAGAEPGAKPQTQRSSAKRSFCSRCGARVEAADRFCPTCGTRVI
jgi:hypothetical protein